MMSEPSSGFHARHGWFGFTLLTAGPGTIQNYHRASHCGCWAVGWWFLSNNKKTTWGFFSKRASAGAGCKQSFSNLHKFGDQKIPVFFWCAGLRQTAVTRVWILIYSKLESRSHGVKILLFTNTRISCFMSPLWMNSCHRSPFFFFFCFGGQKIGRKRQVAKIQRPCKNHWILCTFRIEKPDATGFQDTSGKPEVIFVFCKHRHCGRPTKGDLPICNLLHDLKLQVYQEIRGPPNIPFCLVSRYLPRSFDCDVFSFDFELMITFSCSEVKQIQACGLQKGKAGDRCRFEWAHRRGRCVGWHMKGPHQCLIIEGEQLVFTTVLLISVTYPNTFPVAMMVQWELTLSYSQGNSRVNFDMTPPWFLTFPVYHQVNVKKTMKNMYV